MSVSACRSEQGGLSAPVLSEQMTETEPSVSTDGSFLTIALRFDIRRTPRARVTVTTMGRPSGIAATASETVPRQPIRHATMRRSSAPPIVNISSQFRR